MVFNIFWCSCGLDIIHLFKISTWEKEIAKQEHRWILRCTFLDTDLSSHPSQTHFHLHAHAGHSSNSFLEMFLIVFILPSTTCQNNPLIRLSCLALWKGLLYSVVPAIKLIVWPTSKETDFALVKVKLNPPLPNRGKIGVSETLKAALHLL